MSNYKDYDQKPRFCVECGKPLMDVPTVEYDPFTGEKVTKGVFLMRCQDDCCAHYAAKTTEGKWRT